jgi:hypothetical protein
MQLVEQHIRESEVRLRHIDELIARARAAEETDIRWRQARAERDRLARQLDDIRSRAPGDESEVVKLGESLASSLRTVGAELEKALAAVLETGR